MEAQDNVKTIAIYYPYFAGGGAEAVALWLLEDLKDRYEVTVFTLSQVDFEQLNTMYGTHLTNKAIQLKTFFPHSLKNFINFLISNNRDIRKILIHSLLRYFKSEQAQYDVVMSAYNAADLGRPGIQYIHWIKVIEGKDKRYHNISQFSFDNLKANLAVANSQKVAQDVKKTYDIDAVVVYPPVAIKTLDLPWHEKENAFICSGRLVSAKQPHKVIQILRSVREKGFDLKLYLTGGGGGIYGWQYQQDLKKQVAENADWVTLYQNLSYEDYAKILYKCKYGIHYKIEPFGISIAEMIRAGAIPFVRSVGGQVEIVGQHHTDLFFSNSEEAVAKIIDVLSSAEKQKQLQKSLVIQQQLFSSEKFMQDMAKVVDNYVTLQNIE